MTMLLGRARTATAATRGAWRSTGLCVPALARSVSHGQPPIKLAAPELWRASGFIDGNWTTGQATKSFAVENPANGEHIGELPEMSVSDVRSAVDAAADAFTAWKRTSEKERHDVLLRLYGLMTRHADDLASIITLENGKPMADAKGEIAYGSSFLQWFAGEAIRNYGDVIPGAMPGLTNITLKQPVGVCGIITPWNFPNAMVTRKLGAALAAGCAVVLKAPAETPYSVLAIAELCAQAGVPPGVVNVVLTSEGTAEAGRELCENPTIRKVSLTGSTRVGKLLMQQSASSLKRLSFELGGNAPFIVFDDADVDQAVAGTVASKFRQSGQTCICANRIYVADEIYDEYAEKLTAAVRKFKIGDGAEEGITHGPLIHKAAVDKTAQHVEDAKSKGAKVLIGGERLDRPGYFYAPTVLADVNDCAINEEETFGPVAALYRFKAEDDVITEANKADVGLAGYFYAKDLQRVWRVARELEVGMVGVNTGAISQAQIPFGGVKQSGLGREGSKYGLQEYQNIKVISMGGV